MPSGWGKEGDEQNIRKVQSNCLVRNPVLSQEQKRLMSDCCRKAGGEGNLGTTLHWLEDFPDLDLALLTNLELEHPVTEGKGGVLQLLEPGTCVAAFAAGCCGADGAKPQCSEGVWMRVLIQTAEGAALGAGGSGEGGDLVGQDVRWVYSAGKQCGDVHEEENLDDHWEWADLRVRNSDCKPEWKIGGLILKGRSLWG